MPKEKPSNNLLSLLIWITGIFVSLAVGFGLIDGVLTARLIPLGITVAVGWIVLILTLIMVILQLAKQFKS